MSLLYEYFFFKVSIPDKPAKLLQSIADKTGQNRYENHIQGSSPPACFRKVCENYSSCKPVIEVNNSTQSADEFKLRRRKYLSRKALPLKVIAAAAGKGIAAKILFSSLTMLV